MLWLALYLPQLQLDSVVAVKAPEQPALASGELPSAAEPAAVVIIDQRQQVCQLNPVAKAHGIRFGMKLGTASALFRSLVFFNLDHDFERQRLSELVNDCYLRSADIALLEPNTLIFEVSSMLRLYGSFQLYWDAIEHVLAAQQLSFSVALADTPLAAQVLACSGRLNLSVQQQFENRAWQLPALCALRAEQLGVPRQQQEQLRRLGLATLGDVHALLGEGKNRSAINELGSRLGRDLVHYLHQLFGRVATPLDYVVPPESFVQSLLLEHEIQTVAALLFPLKNLFQRLQSFLQTRARKVQSLRIYLLQREDAEQVIELASAEPERDSRAWLTLVQLKLDSLVLQSPVLALRLEAGALMEDDSRTQDLFDPQRQLSPKQLMARLCAKLGEHSVQQLFLKDDHRPERAFGYRSLQVRDADGTVARQSNKSKHSLMLRPSLLLEQPVPLAESIRIVHGPERIQGAWWSDAPVCRDYFVARNTEQQTLWVFRDEHQHWFVHGLFA